MSGVISACVGEYESGDDVCDGDSKEKPCGWKNRCKFFKKYLETEDKEVGEYLEPGVDDSGNYYAVPKQGYEEFKKFCNGLINDAKGRSSTKKKIDHRSRGPSAKTKKAAAMSLTNRSQERRRQLLKMFMEFRRTLQEELNGRVFATPGSTVLPGQFYVVNRVDISRYLSIYCKTISNRDVPIASFVLKTYSLTFNVRLPLTIEEFEKGAPKEALKGFKINQINNGRFRMVIIGAGKKELSILAKTIAVLNKNGNIKLPTQ